MENNKSLLPADTYTIINKTIITEYDKRIVNMLYMPIIGTLAVNLYLTFISELDKAEILSNTNTHHHLMTLMQLSLEEIISARIKLEAIGLIKTYYLNGDINDYIYEIYSPIKSNEFFNHPIFNIVLYNNIGKTEYNHLLEYFKIPKISTEKYEDITSSFDSVFASIPLTSYEVLNTNLKEETKRKLIINYNIDFEFLKESFSCDMITDKTFNKEICELLTLLGYIYNFDIYKLKEIITLSLNEKKLIDKTKLRKYARDYYQLDNFGTLPSLIYRNQPEYLRSPKGDNTNRGKIIYQFETYTPYNFLKAKNKCEPTARELRILEGLLLDQQLKPGVVNVLIDYTLKTNNNKLNKNLIEAIATSWKRSNIETVSQAMDVIEKQHKKYQKNSSYKQPNKDEKIPSWFNEEQVKQQISKEEQEEIDNILKEYRQ